MEDVKLNFLHICENAFVSQDKKLSVINIFNQIRASNFPAAHPKFSIVTNISGIEGEYSEVVEIIAPNGEIVARAENNKMIIQKDGAANFIANFIGVVFPVDGKYKIVVKVNNILVDEENFILLSK